MVWRVKHAGDSSDRRVLPSVLAPLVRDVLNTKLSPLSNAAVPKHGFGMRTQGFPSDYWIERFGEWLDSLGLLRK